MKARYSGGPKEKAAFPRSGAKNWRPKIPSRAGDEGSDRHQRQGCPGPSFFGHLVTVEQVMTLAASPGILTRIDVVDPPYIAPYQTPVIMIKPVTGPYFTVKGSIRAIVTVGPNPGRTPTTVPTKAPMKQARRLTRLRELMKPFRSGLKSFHASPLYPKIPLGKSMYSQYIEQKIDEQSRTDGNEQGFPPPFQLHDLTYPIRNDHGRENIPQKRHSQDPHAESENHRKKGFDVFPVQ